MNTTLVPKEGLTAEDSELMLALNRAVISLIDEPRPVFQFTELNRGNRRLLEHLVSDSQRPVQYSFGNMPDFDKWLWLNVYLSLSFNDVPADWNNEHNANYLDLTPKQTTEVFRRARNTLAVSRLQVYATALAEEIAEAARQTAEVAKRGFSIDSDDRFLTVLDQATGPILCGAYTTFTLAAERGVNMRQHVMRFGR